MESITYPSGRTVDYERESCACRVDGIYTTYNSTTKTLMENLSYRPFGGAKAMNTGGGGTVGAGFDDAGRMVASNPGAIHERTFTYDNNGNLTSINAPSTPDFSRVFVYDPLNRLIHAEGPWGDIDYTYDDVGNRQSKTDSGVTEAYTYNPGTNQLDTVINGGSTIYIHDANGNIIGIGNKILSYNQNNRLATVEEDSVILGEYIYNGLGQRIIKTAGGTTTVFHYDFDGNIIGESNTNGTFSKEYIYYRSSRLAMADVATEEVYFYGNDRLGTPQILTDSTNKVVWAANYKPFGEADVHPNSSVENNFRFPGQYYDQETGLHYNYHRYYDPNTGRYLTPDPIGLVYEANLFLYAGNNPINLKDPLGLWTVGIGLGAMGGTGGAGSGSVMIVLDGHGNVGIVESGGGGGMGGINASAGGIVQITTAENIYELKGLSSQTGGSIGEGLSIGGEMIIGKGYIGMNVNIGLGGGLTPVELHSVVEYAAAQGINLTDILTYLKSLRSSEECEN